MTSPVPLLIVLVTTVVGAALPFATTAKKLSILVGA